MKTKIGGSWISLCLGFAIVAAVSSSPAMGQQGEKTSTTYKTSGPGQTAAAAAPASEAQSTSPIVFPIVGKGTINFLPVFTGNYKIGNSLVSQTGNGVSVAGTVNAVAFTGDGSGLSNVPAVQLGGLPATAFAQQGASNTFVGDQTITGNLNLTGYINSAFSFQGNLTDANGQEGADVIGGFAGNAAFGGNSIAPGVIGATIGGGGGVYDASWLPKHPAGKKAALRAGRAGVGILRNPFLKHSPPQGNTDGSLEPEAKTGQAPPPGLISGANMIIVNSSTELSNWATIGGGLQNTASAAEGTVGGGYNNNASGTEATIAGGSNNTASDIDSTVGGGYGNTASGFGDGNGSATVAGGYQSTASGDYSTVGGGFENTASGADSLVSGGYGNIASGHFATVPGGAANEAFGESSFAAGCGAIANSTGSFVWAGYTVSNECFGGSDTGPGQFVAIAPGGVWFYTASDESSGVTLASGSGSWSNLSDRNAKANFLAVDPSALLEKLAAMPVATWKYKTQDDAIRHLGPTAQDFHAAFGLGEDDKHISTVDAEGVALAGIQALYAEMKQSLAEKDREIEDLRNRLARLEQASSGR